MAGSLQMVGQARRWGDGQWVKQRDAYGRCWDISAGNSFPAILLFPGACLSVQSLGGVVADDSTAVVTSVTCASVSECRTIRFVGTLRSSHMMLLERRSPSK